MENGDSLIGEIWYDQLLITPFPGDSTKFYLFNQAVFIYSGVYYNVIDITQDSGRGALVQKNIQLSDTPMVEGIASIKHGNGRDWWVIGRACYGQIGGLPTNEFYLFEVTSTGVQGPFVQALGSLGNSDIGSVRFSHNGKKIAFVNGAGLLELYDFDRCTGVISNPVNIKPELTHAPYPYTWSVEFSPNDSILYSASDALPSDILQYDLNASNIGSSEVTIASISYPPYNGGYLRLAPDNKIYWSFAWADGTNWNYPYPDTSIAYNMYNMNLSVINNPNSLGAACNFQPFSFYLGGKRTYWGLPNNPDYNMPAWGGSPCDTLGYPNSNHAIDNVALQLNIYYHPDWQTVFINASGLSGNWCSIHVVDISGREVFSESNAIQGGYFTKNLNCSRYSAGTYIVLLETLNERLVKKFIISGE